MKWIKASDRLPELGEKVLIFYVSHEEDIVDTARIIAFAKGSRDGEDCYFVLDRPDDNDGCTVNIEEVTHWVPFPDDPEEGK